METTINKKELTIVEARNRLTQLPEELRMKGEAGAVTVTRRGKPVLTVMSYELYDSIMETLEIMSDPETMALLRQSIEEAKAGHIIPWQIADEQNNP
ncbi:MAG TPA: type II toxin-antitoxin system prevent-host-death family antitoxin [Abditibacteriaceae bacterium]|jgi:prevent-host-death family protein